MPSLKVLAVLEEGRDCLRAGAVWLDLYSFSSMSSWDSDGLIRIDSLMGTILLKAV
jgi:hypothetical protein